MSRQRNREIERERERVLLLFDRRMLRKNFIHRFGEDVILLKGDRSQKIEIQKKKKKNK